MRGRSLSALLGAPFSSVRDYTEAATRSLAQLDDLLGATSFELDAASLAALDEASRIELGYPKALLDGPAGRRMVHGELHESVVRAE